eukprot:1372665-Amorphochlora_amoeboformis.AAC.1
MCSIPMLTLAMSMTRASQARSEGLTVFYRGWSVFFSRVAPVFTCLMPFYEQVNVRTNRNQIQ